MEQTSQSESSEMPPDQETLMRIESLKELAASKPSISILCDYLDRVTKQMDTTPVASCKSEIEKRNSCNKIVETQKVESQENEREKKLKEQRRKTEQIADCREWCREEFKEFQYDHSSSFKYLREQLHQYSRDILDKIDSTIDNFKLMETENDQRLRKPDRDSFLKALFELQLQMIDHKEGKQRWMLELDASEIFSQMIFHFNLSKRKAELKDDRELVLREEIFAKGLLDALKEFLTEQERWTYYSRVTRL